MRPRTTRRRLLQQFAAGAATFVVGGLGRARAQIGLQATDAEETPTGTGSSDADQSLSATVDKLFARWDRPDSAGCAVAVIRNGNLLYRRAYGCANLDYGVPLAADSVLEVGSMAKSFTAVCVAMLVDQGQLSVDDDVRKYVPELPSYAEPIRLRHLIQCTSGLRDYYMAWQLIGRDWEDVCTDEDVLRLICLQKKLPFKPGETFAYSNSDYFLLGLIVKRVAGRTLREFAQANVFGPLKMSRTHFGDDRAQVVKDRAIGYHPGSGGQFRRCLSNSNVVGPVGLKTTVDDLVRWNENFNDNKLQGGPLLREFFSQGTLLGSRNTFDTDPRAEYRGLRRMEFTGGVPGHMSCLARFPEQDVSVIVLSNYTNVAAWEFAWQIAELYLSKHMTPSPPGVDQAWDDNPPIVVLPKEELEERAGVFRDASGHLNTLIAKDGRLIFINPYGWEYPLSSLSNTRFRSLETLTEFDLEFRQKQPNGSLAVRLKRIRGKGEWWEPVTVVKPSVAQLAKYSGLYRCDELEVEYRVFAAEGRLRLQVGDRGALDLAPGTTDEFVPRDRMEDTVLVFTRDERDQIDGIKVSLWNVKEMQFAKVN